LHHPENLNNINVNGWANSKIVHIVSERNTQISWALNFRKNYTQLPVFLKLHVTVDYGSLEHPSLGSLHSSGEN
jgi:Tol biopolymer transport system component